MARAAMRFPRRDVSSGSTSCATRGKKGTSSASCEVESGMLTVNHVGLALPEVPFGGIQDSGYGTEGGSDAVEPYLETRFVTALTS